MGKANSILASYPVIGFIILTFLISAISFIIMLKIPETQSPESVTGLPVWLIAIWSPNIAALIIWSTQNKVVTKLQSSFSIPQFSWWFLLALLPIIVVAALLLFEMKNGANIQWSNFKTSFIVPLIFINLLMGPLGEELGWRGFMYPVIKNNYGWMASALVVGIIWALWHAPLWLIESPQSKIPFWAFFVNVICLSILMSMIYNHSHGSVIIIILLHLTFNISLGFIDILGSHTSSEFVIKSLYFYVPTTIILVGIHEWVSLDKC